MRKHPQVKRDAISKMIEQFQLSASDSPADLRG
jgi:hypothetical protein